MTSRALRPAQLPWLLLLFVGSGAAALIYEVVWLQLLQLVIGLTNVSLGLLLGMFMGGMCLGSLAADRFAATRRHPLKTYALLELGIAALGMLMLFLVPWISSLYTAHAAPGVSGLILRGVLAAVCLLPPTLLMGATLPVMARWTQVTRDGVAWLGFLYGANIAGAVVGCLAAGFYLLRLHDMATATFVAAAINAVVAGVALLVAWRSEYATDDVAAEDQQTAEPGDELPRWPVYLAIGLSGLTALGAEVVWTRLLSLLLGGTVYTFSIILAVFLVGLGLGGSMGSHWSRSIRRERLGAALAICQLLLIAGIGWAAVMISSSLPYWPVNPALSRTPWFTFQVDVARCLWVVLPAAFLWGASFPLALAAVASRKSNPARWVGRVYAANTAGAIVGALAFSLVVIPVLGTQSAERLLMGGATVSVLILLIARVGGLARARVLAVGGVVAGAAALIAVIPPSPWGLAAYGRFMATYGDRLADRIIPERDVPNHGLHPDIYCTYLGEGLNGTIAVTKWTSGERNFHSAGKVQASSEARDMRLQRMLGHLSALVHGKPESVLVVACGAGVTAGTFVTHPSTKRIVICDIEPRVPSIVAPMFARENHAVLDDPRTEVVTDDGRHFIRTTREKFDIITSDPIDPWVKGCAALNTVEYFEMCKAHLNPGGLVSLWIPLYESSPTTVKSLVATFFKVFSQGTIWSNDDAGEGYDAVLLGQAGPPRLDVEELESRLSTPEFTRAKRSLADVGFRTATDLLATYAGRGTDLQPWMADAQLNTDANLRLQYLAGWSVNSFMSDRILNEILAYRKFPESMFAGEGANVRRLRKRLGGDRVEK